MTFAMLQPVIFRRSEVEKYEQHGWHLGTGNDGKHAVLLKNGDTISLRDEHVQASDRKVSIEGSLLVFRKKGQIVLSGPYLGVDSMIDMYRKQFLDHELIAVVDAVTLNFSCTEGQGLHPRTKGRAAP